MSWIRNVQVQKDRGRTSMSKKSGGERPGPIVGTEMSRSKKGRGRNVQVQKVMERNVLGAKLPGPKNQERNALGAKCPGPESPGAKRPGCETSSGETSWVRNVQV